MDAVPTGRVLSRARSRSALSALSGQRLGVGGVNGSQTADQFRTPLTLGDRRWSTGAVDDEVGHDIDRAGGTSVRGSFRAAPRPARYLLQRRFVRRDSDHHGDDHGSWGHFAALSLGAAGVGARSTFLPCGFGGCVQHSDQGGCSLPAPVCRASQSLATLAPHPYVSAALFRVTVCVEREPFACVLNPTAAMPRPCCCLLLRANLDTFSGIYTTELHAVPQPDDILGTYSMIFWALTLVVCVKYVGCVMRVSHHGEGGTFALLQTILSGPPLGARARHRVTLLAMLGCSLLLGDGAITPAMSVLGALEGLPVGSERVRSCLAVCVLFALFSLQKHGTKLIGRVAGPLMVTWFLTIGALGVYNCAMHPAVAVRVLGALNPRYLIEFWARGDYRGVDAWRSLGGVVLCVTVSAVPVPPFLLPALAVLP